MPITRSAINRIRRPLVERNYRLMRAAYMAVGRDFMARFHKYGMQVVTDSDIKKADFSVIGDQYEKIFKDTALTFAKFSRANFPKRKKFDGEDFANSKWIRDISAMTNTVTGLFVKTITETTEDELLRIIGGFTQQGIEFGWSIEAIADTIEGQFMSMWGDESKWMARRIAQTETIRASNFGTRAGVDSLGVEYVQSWLAAHDGRERETHAQAEKDNDRIPSTQQFIVGGYLCDYPGDPSLPPEESINCRCAFTAEPADYDEVMGN